MCSILGLFDPTPGVDLSLLRPLALALSARQRHRGPDWSGVHVDPNCLLVHERLAIVDPAGGAQPLRSADGRLALAVNGEIYNHRDLERELRAPYDFQTGSDCEVINALYLEGGPAAFARLNGIYAFALWDAAERRIVIARDPLGVCPLYWGHDGDGRLWLASEMKALARHCADVSAFPPGHVYDSATGELTFFHPRAWRDYDAVAGHAVAPAALREAFEQAVHRQLMTDVPYGVLLSGGLDSSLVAACAACFARQRVEDDDRAEAWWPRLHSFAIGMQGSPDLAAAEVAAKALGTVHHGFTYRFEEGLDALPDVIRHIESYDVTTVRASTPMYLLARRTLVGGSGKMIVYDDLEASEKIKVYDKGITLNGNPQKNGEKVYQMLVGYRTGDMYAPQLDMTEALGRELRQFVECIETNGQPIADGQAGLRVVRILEAATQSLAQRGRVIELEQQRRIA